MAVVIQRSPVVRCANYSVACWLAVCFALGGLACVLLAGPSAPVQRVPTHMSLAAGLSAVVDTETVVEKGYATARTRLLNWSGTPICATLTLLRADGSVAAVESVTFSPAELERSCGWVTVSARAQPDVSHSTVRISLARSSGAPR